MSFSDTVGQMDSNYFHAALCRRPDEAKTDACRVTLRETYRAMSERLHGQTAFVEREEDRHSSDALREFGAVFDKGILALTHVMSCRISDTGAAVRALPALEEKFSE